MNGIEMKLLHFVQQVLIRYCFVFLLHEGKHSEISIIRRGEHMVERFSHGGFEITSCSLTRHQTCTTMNRHNSDQ